MTEQPFGMPSLSPEEQRKIDEKIAADMGITVEELHAIDRRVAEDVRARDAVPQEERTIEDNPKFTKGFGPNTPDNTIQPGEVAEYSQGPFMPPAAPGGPAGPAPIPPRATYDGWTRQPVFYFPVVLRGELVGYLWASVTHGSASFVRKLRMNGAGAQADPFADPSLWATDVWAERLAAAYAQGVTAQDAVRAWVGAPEDPQGGGIPADAAEHRAESLAALYEFANPGGPPPPEPLVQDGMYPDGTPVDRSRGWGPVVSSPVVRYPTETGAGVRFAPVSKDGRVVGYLWASVADDAADYLPRAGDRTGEIAAGTWQLRLSQAQRDGLTPTQALQRCRQQPEDHLAGVIGSDAPEGEFADLAQLKDLARQ
ncbi:hypothetical protein [Nocardia wallacei]|uniref:hypothetical protein n=1 Tax=Nocardia wallacei TaxID=480035 RepID=UPI002453C964|nr:hypothetical protein [Nocardia wallacei]